MRPSQLVTYGAFAGVCVGAGLWMCLQGSTSVIVGAGATGIIVGGVLHLVLLAFAERLERG